VCKPLLRSYIVCLKTRVMSEVQKLVLKKTKISVSSERAREQSTDRQIGEKGFDIVLSHSVS
jgi:hypothetical protein